MKTLAPARIRGAKVLISVENTKLFCDLTKIKRYFLCKINIICIIYANIYTK